MIVLDTHVLVWVDLDDNALGSNARREVETAWASGQVAVSAISFWEVAMLVEKGRLELPEALAPWRRALLDAGLLELPLTGDVGIGATQLADFHPDPADRMICATAMQKEAVLLTADGPILSWQGPLKRMNARL